MKNLLIPKDRPNQAIVLIFIVLTIITLRYIRFSITKASPRLKPKDQSQRKKEIKLQMANSDSCLIFRHSERLI
jgi:hypothetical protein